MAVLGAHLDAERNCGKRAGELPWGCVQTGNRVSSALEVVTGTPDVCNGKVPTSKKGEKSQEAC